MALFNQDTSSAVAPKPVLIDSDDEDELSSPVENRRVSSRLVAAYRGNVEVSSKRIPSPDVDSSENARCFHTY